MPSSWPLDADVHPPHHSRRGIDRQQRAVAGQGDEIARGGIGHTSHRHGQRHGGPGQQTSHVHEWSPSRSLRASGPSAHLVGERGSSRPRMRRVSRALTGAVIGPCACGAESHFGHGVRLDALAVLPKEAVDRCAVEVAVARRLGCTVTVQPESAAPCPTPSSSTCASAPPSRCCRARSGSRRWPRPVGTAGMPAVAVTDDANLFVVMQFCAAAKKAGVQPIVGAMVALAPLEALPRTPGRPAPAEHIVLLVKDATGYGNLLRLLSRAWVGAEPGAEIRVGLDELKASQRGADLPDRRPRRAGRRGVAAGRRQAGAAAGDGAQGYLRRPALPGAGAPWRGGAGRGRAGDARPRLRSRRAAGRDQRRALPGGRGLRRSRCADLHRRRCPGGAGGPAPAHGRAPLQECGRDGRAVRRSAGSDRQHARDRPALRLHGAGARPDPADLRAGRGGRDAPPGGRRAWSGGWPRSSGSRAWTRRRARRPQCPIASGWPTSSTSSRR